MDADINKEFVFRYLAGHSSALQKRMLAEWVREEAHEEQFYRWLVEWEGQQPEYPVDTNKGLDRLLRFVSEEHPPAPPVVRLPQPRFGLRGYRGWMVAATVLLVLVAGGLFRDALRYERYSTGYGQTQTLRLSDGSQVTLNANSTLRVPRFGFGNQHREVLLTGEAAFAVTHTTDHRRFVVKTEKGFDVVVLGTEFTVYARPRGANVVLRKGKVQLRYQEGPRARQLVMIPGDQVTFDPRGRASLRKTEAAQHFAAWKDHRFVFEGTTLDELTELFEEQYGLRVAVPNPELRQLTLYGSFRAKSAEELLRSLTEAAGLSFTQTADSVVISERNR